MVAGATVRVLVVDDSATARTMLSRIIDAEPALTVCGTAGDGAEAAALARTLRPDVITLDVEMPGVDGLRGLERIMQESPAPVVMISALTRAGAAATVRALELGALDFVAKPIPGAGGLQSIAAEIVRKVKQAARHRRMPIAQARPSPVATPPRWARRIVVIACSTGGPAALRTMLTALPPRFAAPIIVVQHMPAGFTAALAERIQNAGPLPAAEAQDGDAIAPGRVLVAPGGYHTTLVRPGIIKLDTTPAQHGVRPAADVTMASAAASFGAAVVGVVLTGMGHDGTRGASAIRASGGHVIAEAASTCVVYGMPRSVAEAGAADRILPLHNVAQAIVEACTMREPAQRSA